MEDNDRISSSGGKENLNATTSNNNAPYTPTAAAASALLSLTSDGRAAASAKGSLPTPTASKTHTRPISSFPELGNINSKKANIAKQSSERNTADGDKEGVGKAAENSPAKKAAGYNNLKLGRDYNDAEIVGVKEMATEMSLAFILQCILNETRNGGKITFSRVVKLAWDVLRNQEKYPWNEKRMTSKGGLDTYTYSNGNKRSGEYGSALEVIYNVLEDTFEDDTKAKQVVSDVITDEFNGTVDMASVREVFKKVKEHFKTRIDNEKNNRTQTKTEVINDLPIGFALKPKSLSVPNPRKKKSNQPVKTLVRVPRGKKQGKTHTIEKTAGEKRKMSGSLFFLILWSPKHSENQLQKPRRH